MSSTVCHNNIIMMVSAPKEVPCLICGCQRTTTTSMPKFISENLIRLSDEFCNLYGINSPNYRLEIETIFQISRLCSLCHQEIAQIKTLCSEIEILKRKIQTIKINCDSKLKGFNVDSDSTVGHFEIETKENHAKLCNYVLRCNKPVISTILKPERKPEVRPFLFSKLIPNYEELPEQNIESLGFDFEEASGLDLDLDCGPQNTDIDLRLSDTNSEFLLESNEDSDAVAISSKPDEGTRILSMSLRKKYKLKDLSVRVERVQLQLQKKFNTSAKPVRLKPIKVTKVMKRQSKLKLAREARHVSFPFACPHPGCFRRYSDELERDGHQKKSHKGISEPFECQICNRRFTLYRKFKDHANVHTGLLSYSCVEPGCDKKYTTKDQLGNHTKRKHSNNNTDIVCEHCGKACPSKTHYEDHLRSHTKELPFDCEICGKFFAYKASLRDHRLTHPELNLDASKCKYCGKKFAGKYYLSVHERSHTGDLRYQCDLCNYATPLSSRLKLHMVSHSDAKSFPCDVCPHLFKSQNHLNQHKKQYHPPTKEFTCADCGKSFSCKKYLKAHEDIHKQVKSLACSLCDRTFAQHTSLNYHMRSTHKICNDQKLKL